MDRQETQETIKAMEDKVYLLRQQLNAAADKDAPGPTPPSCPAEPALATSVKNVLGMTHEIAAGLGVSLPSAVADEPAATLRATLCDHAATLRFCFEVLRECRAEIAGLHNLAKS